MGLFFVFLSYWGPYTCCVFVETQKASFKKKKKYKTQFLCLKSLLAG